jgi:Family of unknown function (DUF5995)
MRRALTACAATLLLALATAAPAAADHHDTNLPWPELLPPQPTSSEVQPGPVPGCSRPTLACVERVIREMTRRWQPLDSSCDHRAVFALTYLRTTEAFLQTLRDEPGFFEHRDWVIWEDVIFADLYFRAYDAYERGRPLPEAWRIAFDAATQGETSAGHDVFLGMNAHIQRDLPHTLAQVGLRTPEGESRKPDHDRVNYILSRVLDPIEDEVAERYDPIFTLADAKPSPLEEFAALELLKSWREGAWRNAERLLNARTDAERRQVEESIEVNARVWAEAFRAGEIPGYSAVRDPHCAAAAR